MAARRELTERMFFAGLLFGYDRMLDEEPVA